MDLTEMKTIVRRDLHDEDSENYRWTDDELERHIARAVKEFSGVFPYEQKVVRSTTAGSREIDISTITGIKITRQGQAIYLEDYDKRVDPYNRTYYWLTGHKVNVEKEEEFDDRAVMNNKISITPIQFDLTNYKFIDELNKWDFNLYE